MKTFAAILILIFTLLSCQNLKKTNLSDPDSDSYLKKTQSGINFDDDENASEKMPSYDDFDYQPTEEMPTFTDDEVDSVIETYDDYQ